MMKFKPAALIMLLSGIFWALIMVSCTPYHEAGRSGKVPPGQAKKIYGHRSARDFAPGHNK